MEDLDRLYKIIREEIGKIDVLFANAGGGELAALGEITEEHFDRTMDDQRNVVHCGEGPLIWCPGRLA
jgi:NAD(P)-dependent dehydrogenase (short-subunit alcohol dehydrogenase family)